MLGASAHKITAIRALGSRCSDAVEPTSRVTGGPYRWLDHPGELGMWAFAVGVWLAVGGPLSLAWLVCVVTPLAWWRSRREDLELTRAYPAHANA